MKRLLLALLLFPAILQAQTFTRRWFHTDQHMSTPIALGSDSVTDGISAAYFTDGTAKGVCAFATNKLQCGTTTNHAYEILANNLNTWDFSAGGNLTQDATNGGNIVMAKVNTSVINGAAAVPADITTLATPNLYGMGTVGLAVNRAGGTPNGPSIFFYKTQHADGSADTIVANNDALGQIYFMGADGTNFDIGASIVAQVDGTPSGGTDMPSRLVFSVSPDGSATPAEAMRISQDKKVTLAAGIVSSATDVGWVVRAGADTACTTTCGANKGCLFGIDAGAAAVVACATATADTCLCSQ